MTRILVLTDLSANSRAGIRFAMQLAGQMTDCTLIFCHFIEVTKPTRWSDLKYRSFAEERIAAKRSELEKFVTELYDQGALAEGPHEFFLRISTDVIGETQSVARKVRADMICLGTRGQGKVKKLLGSNAAELLSKSKKPVIVVPPSWRFQRIGTILYSSDLEKPQTEIRKLSEFSGEIGATIIMYHYNAQLVVSENTSALEKKVRKFPHGDKFKTRFRAFPPGERLEALLARDGKKEKASMLAMFTRQKRGWFSRLFEPSHASAVAARPLFPVLVFRK